MRLRDHLKKAFEPLSISDFFDDSTCQSFIESAEEKTWRVSNLGNRKIQTMDVERSWLEDRIGRHSPARILDWSYRGLHPATCQVFKYAKGDSFPDHQDAPIEIDVGLQSLFTFVVYLNDCKGGVTGFPEKGCAVAPKRGRALLFPQNLIHNSSPIEDGLKYILRAQIIYENRGTTAY